MRLIFRPFCDPPIQQGFVSGTRLLHRIRRRHHLIRVGAVNTLGDQGLGSISFHNGWSAVTARGEGELFSIKAEGVFFGLPRGGVRAMTMIAVFRKNWLNLLIERNGLSRQKTGGQQGREKEKMAAKGGHNRLYH